MGGAPHVALSAVKKFSNAKESAKLNFNGLKIKEYLEKLDDPNVTEETKKIIKSEIDKLTIESSNLVNDKIEKISKMPEDDINKVLDNSKRISDIIVEVDVVKEDESLSVEQKQAMLDNMKQETSNLIKENEDLSSKESKEENPYYYNTDPNRGEVEQKPSVVPEGYTTVKEVQNGFELDAWKKQKEVVKPEIVSEEVKQDETIKTEAVESGMEAKTPSISELETELSDKEGKLSRARSESRKATLQSEIDGIKSEIEKLSEKPAEEIKKEEVSLQDIEEVNEDNFNDVIKNLKERGLIENPCK